MTKGIATSDKNVEGIMAYLTSFEFLPSGDPIIDAATQGSVWDLPQNNVIHWTIADGFNGEFWLDPSFTVAKIEHALSIIEQYINVDFQYGGYFADPISAGAAGSDLVYSLDGVVLSPSTWAVGFFPNYDNVPIGGSLGWPTQGGDIFFNINSEANYLDSYEPGSAGFFLLLHETLHALGMKHTFDSGGTGRPTLQQLGLGAFDKDWFSVMSYGEDYPLNQLAWDPATPMLLDVLGLQYLYGANQSANIGDTIYTVTYENYYATVWDAGGTDLIDLSQVPEGWFVELPNIQLSELLHTKAGSAVPTAQASNDTVNDFAPTNLFWLTGDIENVLGSGYDDEILGNDLNNWLRGEAGDDLLIGNGGNDLLYGGSGTDTAVFSGNSSEYSARQSAGKVIVTDSNSSRDGVNTLENIEVYRFSNGDVNLADIVAPTTTDGGIYRHYNSDTGTHFYTSSSVERNSVINNITSFNYEGVAFKAAPTEAAEAANVWRFYNSDTGVHFYTISEAERDSIIENLPSFNYEGSAYTAYETEVDGSVSLHRFFNTETGSHFYTASDAEQESIESSLAQYYYEGVAYYVDVA